MMDCAMDTMSEFRRCVATFMAPSSQKVWRMPYRLARTKGIEKLCGLLGTHRKVQVDTFWGGRMTVVFPESVSVSIARYRFFEEGLTYTLLQYMKPGMVFFDVGSHFGYFSLLAGWLAGPRGQVHAFEPTPSTYRVLSENLAGKSSMRANNLAVSSSESTLQLTDYGLALSAYNTVKEGKLGPQTAGRLTPVKHAVQAIPLDDYVARTGVAPHFIKVDAEGAELDILRGMPHTLATARPAVSLEVGDKGADDGMSSSRQALLHLIAAGYQPWEYADGRLIQHEVRDRYGYDNILLLPVGQQPE